MSKPSSRLFLAPPRADRATWSVPRRMGGSYGLIGASRGVSDSPPPLRREEQARPQTLTASLPQYPNGPSNTHPQSNCHMRITAPELPFAAALGRAAVA